MFPRPLLIAPFLMLAANCSSTPVLAVPQAEFPPPPSALIGPCPDALIPPDPLIDPERLAWEADTLAKLTACKAKHGATVEAWQEAVKARRQ